ncbi:MAG: hypothetical protein HY235_06410 [Acidobacteria bacterium]|nr:hypothetical protein [Acidobacteriota bacterium]
MKKERRRFLAAAAALALPCDPEAEALAAQGPASGASSVPESRDPMPSLKLGKYTVSRLIIGSNPLHGYSHFNQLFSRHMTEWADRDRVCGIMARCERHGINTWQFSHHERALGDFKRHREMGGRMQWILLSHRDIEEDHKLIKEVAKLGPMAIVHHGGSAERKRRAGRNAQIRDFLKAVRDQGVMAGLSTHDPNS